MAHYRKATYADCIALAPNLREEDVLELSLSSGEAPLDALIGSLQVSEECNAIISDDGDVIGMFGVATIDETLGSPWLLGAPGIKDIAREFIAGSKAWVESVQERYPILVNFVHEENLVAIRWLQKLGFIFIRRIEDYGAGEAPFYEFVRTELNV